MAFLMPSLFGRAKRPVPPTVPTDEVVPLGFFDSTSTIQGMIVAWTLRFNDVLDPAKVHGSLEQLLATGTWRKLGGRLRRNGEGKLELHIPASFTAERPASRFTHVSFDVVIEEHPVASQLPKPTPGPSIHPGPTTFRSLSWTEDVPRSIDDFLCSDRPQLTLHMVTFADATLLTLVWPHTMTDAMGRHALVKEWSAVLAAGGGGGGGGREGGKESKELESKVRQVVHPLLGFDADPMARIGSEPPPEPYVNGRLQLRGLALAWWFLRYLVEGWFGPRWISRTVCIPATAMASLREEAMAALPEYEPDDPTKKTFVSDGDILTAWTTRMACCSMARDSRRQVGVINAVDVRGVMSRPDVGIFVPGGNYVQNAILATFTMMRAGELLTQPLGAAAARFRAALKEQITPGQIHASAYTARQSFLTTGMPPFFGDRNMFLVVFSNWTKGKFFDVVDFGPAVVKSGVPLDQRPNALGKPLFYHSQLVNIDGLQIRNVANILGKDSAGNYWITGLFSEATWDAFAKALEESAKRS